MTSANLSLLLSVYYHCQSADIPLSKGPDGSTGHEIWAVGWMAKNIPSIFLSKMNSWTSSVRVLLLCKNTIPDDSITDLLFWMVHINFYITFYNMFVLTVTPSMKISNIPFIPGNMVIIFLTEGTNLNLLLLFWRWLMALLHRILHSFMSNYNDGSEIVNWWFMWHFVLTFSKLLWPYLATTLVTMDTHRFILL